MGIIGTVWCDVIGVLVANDLLIQQFKDVSVVDFQNVGVLDGSNIDALGRTLMEMVQKQDHRKLVLDFSLVRFMSSQALGVLIQLKKATDLLKGRIIIVGLRPDLLKVFKITNLHKLFTFHETQEKGLAEFNIFIPRS